MLNRFVSVVLLVVARLKHSLKLFLEWYLGIAPAEPGEGTAWSLDTALPGRDVVPQIVWWGLLLLAVVAIGATYQWDARALARRKRATLILLRLASFGLILLMLSQLTLHVERTSLPTITLLVDVSASMGLTDDYSDATRQQAASQYSSMINADDPTRLAIAQGILSDEQGSLLRKLASRYRLHISSFAETPRPLAPHASDSEAHTTTDSATATSPTRDSMTHTNQTDPVAELATAIRQLIADGPQTRPAPVVIATLDEFRGGSLAAVVVLTDGIATVSDREQLSEAAQAAREQGVPLYIIGIGSEQPVRDVELFDVRAESNVYLGDPVTLRFRVRNHGFAGKELTIRLSEQGDPEPLAQSMLNLRGDGAVQSGDVTFVPTREGHHELLLEAVPLSDESDTSNNRETRSIDVTREQMRVLLVERAPRWEYRALKPVLERDDAITLETLLQEADLNFAPEDRTALSEFPATKERLAQYDAIIWGDIDLSLLNPRNGELLKDYVAEQGGGLILIGGPGFNPLSYGGSPLEPLLPVQLEGAAIPPAEQIDGSTRFRFERTPEGESWPFMRLADSSSTDGEVWQSLPQEHDWFIETPLKKPGTQVLAVHSTRQGSQGKLPLIALQRYGRGIVLYHGCDELWKWRRRVEDRYYGRYWSQAIRAIARSRQQKENESSLRTDREIYDLGDDVQLRLRPAVNSASEKETEATFPAEITIAIQPAGGEPSNMILQHVEGPRPLYEGIAHDLPLGKYQAIQQSGITGGRAAVTEFLIRRPERELAVRQMNRADLMQAAKLSHGRFLTIDKADELPALLPAGRPDRLAQSQPVPLWNRWDTLCLLVLLLAVEWLLRKRWRLA